MKMYNSAQHHHRKHRIDMPAIKDGSVRAVGKWAALKRAQQQQYSFGINFENDLSKGSDLDF